MSNDIEIKNARIHNLKNIDVVFPRDKFIVVTGISGSGKSSLVFDILFEEGRKKYLQSIGFPPRVMEDPPFDVINGLSPTIAIEQRIVRLTNPRSTVGTKTSVYNYLRMLYSIDGMLICPICKISAGSDLVCEQCGMTVERLPIKYFSHNEPSGMCLYCQGRGSIYSFIESNIIPDTRLNLKQICKKGSGAFGDLSNFLPGLAKAYEFDLNTSYAELPKKVKQAFLHGSDDEIEFHRVTKRQEVKFNRKFEGVIPRLNNALSNSVSLARRQKIIKKYMERACCPQCQGYRINETARGITINGRHIGELSKLSVKELNTFLQSCYQGGHFSVHGKAIAKTIITNLDNFEDVGLSYLSLYREIPSLSGGELQRLSLISHIDSKLNSIIYILDEPTIGLHELEKQRLINKLFELKALENTVIVIEHDKKVIENAQYLLEIGPGAGVNGGEVIYAGSINNITECERSATGAYLAGKKSVFLDRNKKVIDENTPRLGILNVSTNNLKNINVMIPLGAMVGISGVSGSGKSSLITHTLVPLLKQTLKLNGNKYNPEEEETQELDYYKMARLSGHESLDAVVVVSQAPIGRTRKSIPASYIGIWDKIRKIFASLPRSVDRGFGEGHFSFNSESGRCPACNGDGLEQFQVSFLSDISIPCKECQGKRFQAEILDVTFNDKTIYDVLEMSVSEAKEHFSGYDAIVSVLDILIRTGMEYIKLGQPATTLSGGEAQRIKLARELGNVKKNNVLYVLDEPTIGLGFQDVEKLMLIINELVTNNNSVLIIEHDPAVLTSCDWIIELGPVGGPKGGHIINEGPPSFVKNQKNSNIAEFLLTD